MTRRAVCVGCIGGLAFGVLVDGCSGVSPSGFDPGSEARDATTTADSSNGDAFVFGGGTDATVEAGLSDAALFNDGSPLIDGMSCVDKDAGPAPFPQRCVTATNNECDGPTDQALTSLGLTAALLNGAQGNGFDDDCDGLVDEGCPCPGNGQTKSCFLLPATQADPATNKPVGWCTTNSMGSLDCAGTEFQKWSGVCRGAQPPYPHDVCAMGDFNCDGEEENSDTQNCTCISNPVTCPTVPIVEAPYPDPKNIQLIDGSQWMTNAADRPLATNWMWTVIGGDCDNVLPHPTFALYKQTDSTVAGARNGTRTPVQYDANAMPARLVSTAGQPLISIQTAGYGDGVAGGQVYPAFGLSGDYVVQGEWDLTGKHYACTQKVQVRAPGIRAELCWDTTGGQQASNGNDLDLHFARLQGVSCPAKGWDITCFEGGTLEDCYFDPTSGCPDFSIIGPGWGYADSANSACYGWSSKRHPIDSLHHQGCTNPRLDADNITCDPSNADPTSFATSGSYFCGPENINLDNPKDGDAFVVGVNHYGNNSGTPNAKPHVNLYCNGERVVSAGYNPVTGQVANPVLVKPGGNSTGDIWTVGTVQAHVTNGQLTSCTVQTVPSHHADQTRDGVTNPASSGNQVCVDSVQNASAPPNVYNYTSHAFIQNVPLQGGAAGGIPSTVDGFCKH